MHVLLLSEVGRFSLGAGGLLCFRRAVGDHVADALAEVAFLGLWRQLALFGMVVQPAAVVASAGWGGERFEEEKSNEVGCCRGHAWEPTWLCSQSWAQNGPAAGGMWGQLFGGRWWPHLQHSQFGHGLVVLLGTQEMAANPRTETRHSEGDKNQGCRGFHPSGSITALAPLPTDPAPRVTRYGPKACGRAGTGNRTTGGPSQENGCRDCGHRCGDNPKRDFSHGCTLAALVPWVPPSHWSSVGRGSCLVSILNPASI